MTMHSSSHRGLPAQLATDVCTGSPQDITPQIRPWFRPPMHFAPKYLLFTESIEKTSGSRLWRFLLIRLGNGGESSTVSGSEVVENTTAVRAELLAVVRGLEAVDCPGEVKLFSASQYVRRGVSRGLAQWKSQDWHWERFGRRVPIRDIDLWQRIDHALSFHSVECQAWDDSAAAGQEHSNGDGNFVENCDVQKGNEPVVVTAPTPTRRRITLRRRLKGIGEQVGALMEPTLAPAG